MDTAPRGRNAPLRAVLRFKVAFTVVAWAAPLLLAPCGWFTAAGFPAPRPMIFIRLLGAAFAALLVGYVRGLRALDAGRPPADAVVVGIVSNGLAAALLLGYGVAGAFAEWGAPARMFMGISTAATALITIGLFAFRPDRSGGA
jgi:hypothetical protein